MLKAHDKRSIERYYYIVNTIFSLRNITDNLVEFVIPGGKDCFNFSAFSLSVMTRVYRNLEQRTLNLTLSAFFLIFTAEKKKWQINYIMQEEIHMN